MPGIGLLGYAGYTHASKLYMRPCFWISCTRQTSALPYFLSPTGIFSVPVSAPQKLLVIVISVLLRSVIMIKGDICGRNRAFGLRRVYPCINIVQELMNCSEFGVPVRIFSFPIFSVAHQYFFCPSCYITKTFSNCHQWFQAYLLLFVLTSCDREVLLHFWKRFHPQPLKFQKCEKADA